MNRLVFTFAIAAILSSCASQETPSEAELRISAIADESSRRAPFPVLGPLPSAEEVVGEGIPVETAMELRSAASELANLRDTTAIPRSSLSTEATVMELRAMVAELQSGQTPSRPAVDVSALDFPTPPPLN